jgi:hypothetical protein
MIKFSDYEKFLGGPTPSTQHRLHVTINKEFVIGINENCYRLLGKPAAAYLHFSRKRASIAVEAVDSPRLPAAFPVKKKNSTGWRINASPFCKHFNIRLDTTERFIAPEIRDRALHLKLNETVTVRQLRRKKKPRS